MTFDKLAEEKSYSVRDEELELGYCPQRPNVVNMDVFPNLLTHMKVVEDIVCETAKQQELLFNDICLSGNYTSDYVGRLLPKAYYVESAKNFPFELCPQLEISSPKHGYLPAIDRCWFYLKNTIYMWPTNKPNNVYIGYPIEESVQQVFAYHVQRETVYSRIRVLIFFVGDGFVSIYVGAVLYDIDNERDSFDIDLTKRIVLNTAFTITCGCRVSGGRIFLGADDHEVYELDYEVNDGKLAHAKMVNVSSSLFMTLVPSFLSAAASRNPITQIETAAHSKLLFCLDVENNVTIYSIKDALCRLVKVEMLSFSSIERQCTLQHNQPLAFKPTGIVAIHAVKSYESLFTQLIILFDNGFRAYFSSVPNLNNQEITSSYLSFRLLHLRQPPYDDFSAVGKIYGVYLSLDHTVFCTSYRDSYRLWCLSRSVRCGHNLFQERIVVYCVDQAVEIIQRRIFDQVVEAPPYLVSSCYNPKPVYYVSLQDFIADFSFVCVPNESTFFIVEHKKDYQLLLAILQQENYIQSKQFISLMSHFSDVDFNIACMTILGKIAPDSPELLKTVLKLLWQVSADYQVNYLKGVVFKSETENRLNGTPIPTETSFKFCGEMPSMRMLDVFSKPNCTSFLFYTLVMHSSSLLSCIWNSRVLYFDDSNQCYVSINLEEAKYFRVKLDQLLNCIRHILVFYKDKLANVNFSRSYFAHQPGDVDLLTDTTLIENLELLTKLTYQWLCIWTGINVRDPMDFLRAIEFPERFKLLTYSDLIFKQSECTDELIWSFLAYIRLNRAHFDFLTSRWPQDAACYFVDSFREIAIANNRLVDALTTKNKDLVNRNLSHALEVYLKFPKYLDLTWICRILKRLGYQPNAISLISKVANTYTREGATTAAAIRYPNESQAHNVSEGLSLDLRKYFSRLLFDVLNHSYVLVETESKTKSAKELEFRKRNLRCCIDAALSVTADEELCFDIFDWVVSHDFGYILCQCSSSFLTSYLCDIDYTDLSLHALKKARCLYDFHEFHKNYILAAEQLYKIATARIKPEFRERNLLIIRERSDYLNLALAQIGLTSMNRVTSELITDIKKALNLIEIQHHVLDEIKFVLECQLQHEPPTSARSQLLISCHFLLANNVISSKSMLNDVVFPCRLSTSYLLLVCKGGVDIDDAYLMNTWLTLFDQTASRLGTEEKDVTALFSDLLRQYARDTTFPFADLVYHFEVRLASTTVGHRWLPDLLDRLKIKSHESYTLTLQDIIYRLINDDLDSQPRLDALLYIYDTYVILCQVILRDPAKRAFADTIKAATDYLDHRLQNSTIQLSFVRLIRQRSLQVADIVVKFYEKLTM